MADVYADVVATLAFGLSGWNLWHQRTAALAPQFDLQVTKEDEGPSLRITCLGPLDYDTVHLHVMPPPPGFPPVVESVMYDKDEWEVDVALGPLRVGQSVAVLLNRADGAPAGTARLLFSCRKGRRTWRALQSVALARSP
jgi:hypothetical protein